MERKTDNWPKFIRILFTPTRALFDSRAMKSWRWLTIKKWSLFFLCFNSGLLLFLPSFSESFFLPRIFVGVILYAFPFSRLIEIFYAFFYDAIDRIDGNAHSKTALKKTERLILAAQSYVEVSVCFAIFYKAMPLSYFSTPVTGINCSRFADSFNWFYFSWVTITTTGYGDITPRAVLAKIVSMSEIAFGLLLLVFTVGAYFSYRVDRAEG